MNDNEPKRLIILAGGASRRMGEDKAQLELAGQRLIDHVIKRLSPQADWIGLSAAQDYGTRLPVFPDDPDCPAGPVGAIFTLARRLPEEYPATTSFYTAPVDAPFAPPDLIARLAPCSGSAVAHGPERMHPVFARWDCAVVNAVRTTHDPGTAAPSLHWLVRQCDAALVSWEEEAPFLNINTPDELTIAVDRLT